MQIWDYLPTDAPAVVVYLLVSVALYLFNCQPRPPVVKGLAYFPVLQCRPIRLLEVHATKTGFPLDRHWAIFTEENTVADVSQLPFLADIQPVLLYEYSAAPYAMQLSYGSRSCVFPLAAATESFEPFTHGAVAGSFAPESAAVTQWLFTLFRVPLVLGKVVHSADTSPVLASTASHFQCEGRCTLTANIVVEHADYDQEQRWEEFCIGGALLRKCDRTSDWMPAEKRWSAHALVRCEVLQEGFLHLEDELRPTKLRDSPHWQ